MKFDMTKKLKKTFRVFRVLTQKQTMNTKKQILERATALFFRNGIRSVTMNDVAEALGISKRTLYEHFSNKDELLSNCLEFQHGKNLEEQARAEKEAKNIIDLMHRHFRNAVIQLREIHPNFINELRKFHPEIWNTKVEPLLLERDDHTKNLIIKGIEEGFFLKEVNPEIACKLLHAQSDMMMDPNLFPPGHFSLTDVFRHIAISFIRGFATERGLKEIENLFFNPNQEIYV